MSDLFSQCSELLTTIELPEADVRFKGDFLPLSYADVLLQSLHSNTKWRQEQVRVWGKWHMQPRLVAWHGDKGASYSYSGSQLEPMPWTSDLLSLKTLVEEATKTRFNSVLLNLYRDQNDSMGWHSDDERELGETPTIASISLGDTREFLFKHKRNKSLGVRKISLSHGSLLVMSGSTQKNWLHAINRETTSAGRRINLTFRQIHSQHLKPVQGGS